MVDRGRYCHGKWFDLSRCGSCAQRSEGALFVHPSVEAIPGGPSAPRFNGGIPSRTQN